MDDKRQKNQLELAFMEEDRGEAPKGLPEGTESSAGKRGTESPAIAEQLMEEVCGRENCKQALKRVKANKGSAGVDGMTVQQLPEYLKQHWPGIREQLLSGTYVPQPVKRVEIPKPEGGVRKLGIPTVLDRFRSVLEAALARNPGTVAERDLCAAAGEAGGNPQAGGRGAEAWHPDGAGPIHPAGGDAGTARQMGPDVFRSQLRVSAWALGASGGGTGAAVYRRRLSLGGGSGPGEILRPGQP